jgi:hypothetical protein
VHGAEDGVDGVAVVVAVLHGQEPAFKIGEQFLAFLKEGDLDGL